MDFSEALEHMTNGGQTITSNQVYKREGNKLFYKDKGTSSWERSRASTCDLLEEHWEIYHYEVSFTEAMIALIDGQIVRPIGRKRHYAVIRDRLHFRDDIYKCFQECARVSFESAVKWEIM